MVYTIHMYNGKYLRNIKYAHNESKHEITQNAATNIFVINFNKHE